MRVQNHHSLCFEFVELFSNPKPVDKRGVVIEAPFGCLDGKASLVCFSKVCFCVECREMDHVNMSSSCTLFCTFTLFIQVLLDVLSLSTTCTNLYILLNMHMLCKDGLIFTQV